MYLFQIVRFIWNCFGFCCRSPLTGRRRSGAVIRLQNGTHSPISLSSIILALFSNYFAAIRRPTRRHCVGSAQWSGGPMMIERPERWESGAQCTSTRPAALSPLSPSIRRLPSLYPGDQPAAVRVVRRESTESFSLSWIYTLRIQLGSLFRRRRSGRPVLLSAKGPMNVRHTIAAHIKLCVCRSLSLF